MTDKAKSRIITNKRASAKYGGAPRANLRDREGPRQLPLLLQGSSPAPHPVPLGCVNLRDAPRGRRVPGSPGYTFCIKLARRFIVCGELGNHFSGEIYLSSRRGRGSEGYTEGSPIYGERLRGCVSHHRRAGSRFSGDLRHDFKRARECARHSGALTLPCIHRLPSLSFPPSMSNHRSALAGMAIGARACTTNPRCRKRS